MKLTEIRINPQVAHDGKLLAFVTMTFDAVFAVRNVKIIDRNGKPMLCMPSRFMPDGTFKDICHPVSQEFRAYLEREILGAYEKQIAPDREVADDARAIEVRP